MNNPEFQKAYAEQNQRDYVRNAVFGSIVSIPLNLSCSLMDYGMYPEKMWDFFKLRVLCALVTAVVWAWFRSPRPCHRRLFGVTWFMGPLMMIFWMIYILPDPLTPYYAGLNIILLAMGLISPWTWKQNLIITIFVLAMYVAVIMARPIAQPLKFFLNNSTFLFLTAAFVVLGSVSNARSRLHEFTLRWELDKNRLQLEETNKKLMEVDQLKSRFFANVSHELRTPLTLLIAPLEKLMRSFDLDAQAKDLLATMHTNGMRLLKLINDLLDLVRLEAGRVEVKREPIDVAEFVKAIGSTARQVAEEKRLRLETSVDSSLGTLLADRDKLDKIVLNLVFNALKFTPVGGRVELRAERRGASFVLAVRDTGIGISEKNLEHVFDRFWQADGASNRKFQGLGIGLALVKELTEIQGGTVTVESREGEGATFTVRLPYVETDRSLVQDVSSSVPEAQPGAGGSQEWLAGLYRRAELFPAQASGRSQTHTSALHHNGSRPRILVADDEPEMLRFLKSQLSSHYEVIEVVNGQQAVDKSGECEPELILLDMMMPEKDGLQACREIRARESTHNVPIVLLTARADEETKLTSLSAGASDFLAKPFSLTELHVRLKNLVESHRYQRNLAKQNHVLESTIDQLKQTELQLVQSEKLASLGRLSAGLIHEINNPLNFATTGLFALRSRGRFLEPAKQQEYAEILRDVEDGIGRVKNIVLDLRTFTHPESEQREEVRVAEIVSSTVRFLGSELRNRIHLQVSIPEEQTIWANKNKLIQVVLNLAQNSVDALKAKTFAQGEHPSLWIDGRVENGKSILVVRDNGMGISRENLDKIFDPFFTTKDVGQGMGLGLSICYRIVQSCQGKINVRTERGKFCEFTLEFPLKTEV